MKINSKSPFTGKDIETEKDKAIDLGSQVHHTHLGQIADRIVEWKGEVAEQLKLSPAEIAGIEVKHPKALNLQAYVTITSTMPNVLYNFHIILGEKH